MKRRMFLLATSLLTALAALALLAALTMHRPVQAAPTACVPGPHSGTIDADEAWCIGNSPHLITGNVIVLPGATLTIQEGVIVKTRAGAELQVQGHLRAIGTAAQHILFTSEVDTGPGQWHGLYFKGGTGDLEHVVVRYAGPGNSDAYRGNIVARNVLSGELRISNSEIRDQRLWDYTDVGLNVNDSHVVVSNTLFTGNGGGVESANDAPMRIIGAFSVVTMTGNSFVGNMHDQVFLYANAMMAADARLTPQTLLEGYRLVENYVVPQDITLTVEPGVTVMGNYYAELQVLGHLNAIGTPDRPITFTSEVNTGASQWKGIYFNGGTGDLRYVTARYAGPANSGGMSGNIVAHNVLTGEVRISDSVIREEYRGSYTDAGLLVVDSHVTVSNTLFTQNGGGGGLRDAPMKIQGRLSMVTMTANTFVNNLIDRVLLYPDAMMAANARLSPQTRLQGYELPFDFTVPPTVTLTVEPGVTVMGNAAELRIQGRLEALGTSTQPITFTSATDNAAGQWKGIFFDGGTGNLGHVVARYGGGANSSGLRGNIVAYNVSPGGLHIEQSRLRNSSYYALMVRDSHVTLDDSAVTNNGSYSVYIDGSSVVTMSKTLLQDNRDGMYVGGTAHVTGDRLAIENNRYGAEIGGNTAVFTLTNSAVVLNTSDGVYNGGNAQVTLGGAAGRGNTIMANRGRGANQVGTGTQMLATYNWWGEISGPTHASNPGGQGEDVSNRVIFAPWAVQAQGTAPTGVYVAVGGARTAPPGGSVAHTVLYLNGRTETITDTVLELQLPARAAFVSASHGGIYWPQRHEVVWRLGNLAPGASGLVAAQVRYAWGLSNGTLYAVQARLAGPALPLGLSDPPAYLDLAVPALAGMTALTPAQFNAERAAYPELDALYTQALAEGFVDGGAVRLDLDAGAPITQAALLLPAQGEVRYLRRQGDQVLASTFAAQAYSAQTSTGSMTVDWRTDVAAFTGAWGDGATPTPAGEAYAACRFANLPGSVLDEKATQLAQTFASATCYPCRHGDACAACGAALQRALPLPEAVEPLGCFADAGAFATSATLSIMQDPEPNVKVTCYRGWTDWWYGRPWTAKFQAIVGNRLVGGLVEVTCNANQSCKAGYGYLAEVEAKIGNVGCVCKENAVAAAQTWNAGPMTAGQPEAGDVCSANEAEGVSQCLHTEIFRPRDPNAKYGLEGDLVPGQLVTYTITYENEGAGRAYGVFITDKLDDAFDLATLTLYGPGQLIAANRTLLWDIGELGPKGDPDSQGVVSFTVTLRNDLLPGTAVINQATVFFPTVGEETPTNAVVNVVQPLAAVPQQVETTYRQPVAITLAGRGPAGAPLAFHVLEEPLNGELSGAAPDLVYTPAENATGLDTFTFKVRGAGQESRPAQVQIVIDPAGDTIPPVVWWTYPADGTAAVPVSANAIFTDDVGPVYGPLPFVQFSEALDAATVTEAAVQMLDGAGQPVPVSVGYDGVTRRAMIYPRQAQQAGMTYTVRVAAGVKDLAGNPLAAAHTWSFTTKRQVQAIYLPLVLRNQ